MQDITTEKKLQLVQQIRTQHNRNQYDLSNREQILYGRTSDKNKYYSENINLENDFAIEGTNEKSTSESLKFRSALAAMLFIFAIIFDFFGIKPGGLEMQHIFATIAEDYQENVNAFVETITKSGSLGQ